MGILPGVLRLWNWVAYYFLPKNITKIDHLPLANRQKNPELFLSTKSYWLFEKTSTVPPTNERHGAEIKTISKAWALLYAPTTVEKVFSPQTPLRDNRQNLQQQISRKKNHFSFPTDRSRAQLAEQEEGPPASRFHSSCHSQCGGAAGLRAGGGGDCLLPNLPPMFVAKKTIAHHNAEFFLHTPLSVKMPERYRGAREIYW